MATRTDIASGTPVEVAYEAAEPGAPTKTFTGRFLSWYDGDDLRIATGRGIRRIPPARVRYVSPIPVATIARRFAIGDRAYVQKYGNGYTGTVTRVGRTRVTVMIRLASGKTRTHAHYAADVATDA